ncbi:hypothetical protein K9M42_02470 [Patescibacteria group bacterium]|nr:hypothetical protein [Patescibacteria group bacterium]
MKNKIFKITLIIIITIFLAFLTSVLTNYKKIDDNNSNNISVVIENKNENLLNSYINQNIEELSPKKSIGENFTIKNVEFLEEDLVNIEYSDENNLYKARVTFETENENIEITSFQIIENSYVKSYNFEKEGNIKKENDDYILIYDEEGAPATTRNLFFKEYTKCKDKNLIKFPCSELDLEVGERVKIIGYEDENNVDIYEIIEITKDIVLSTPKNTEEITNFEECEEAGFEVLYPDCIGCKPQCITDSGEIFNQE